MNEYRPQFEERREENATQNPPNYGTSGINGAGCLNYGTFLPYGVSPKEYEEKRDIKKRANATGVSIIVAIAIALVWSLVYIFVLGKLGFSVRTAHQIMSDPAVLQIVQVVLSILMFTLPFTVIFGLNGLRASELVSFKRPKKGNRLAMYFIGLAFCAFSNTAVSLADGLFGYFGFEYNVNYGESPSGFFGFMLCVISTVAVPALVEEFAFRGLVLGSLKKYGEGFAIIVSSVVFGLMHGNFEQMPFAFSVGLVLGFITIKTESLLIACAVHATNNAVSVIFDFLPSTVSQSAQNVMYIVFIMVCMLLGIAALFCGGALSNDAFTLKKGDCETDAKHCFKYFFTSPAIIVATVICVLESFTYF